MLLGFAAINGGINLLFLMFGLLLCLLIANGVLSEAAMRRLDVRRLLPASIHAGSPFLIGISVRNRKERIPTFSLEIEDLAADGKPIDRRCFFLKIPARRQQETSYRRTIAKRGIHRLTGLRISTRFPFGLLRRSINIDAPAELLVYPSLVPVTDLNLTGALSPQGEKQNPARARSGDFHGLRELRAGDDPRDIHWRTTARRGRPFVREFEEETGRNLIIVLDTGASHAVDDFESAVSHAASLALLLLRRGFRIGLLAGRACVAPGAGPLHAGELLRCLALVDRETPDEAPPICPCAGSTTLTITPAAGRPRIEVGTSKHVRRIA